MKQRINYFKVAPEAMDVMLAFEKYAKTTDISPKMIELIKIRTSQINGCAYCLDMHIQDAQVIGETDQRINTLSAWRETPFFTAEEQAVLKLTEAVTMVSESGVSDDLYEEVREYFNEKDFVDLIILINTINSWNRLAISMKSIPGNYKPKSQ